MKEMLKIVYVLMEKYAKGFSDYREHFGKELDELKKLIEALPNEEKLEDNLSDGEKKFLRRRQ